MEKFIRIANAVLTLPFGIAALAAPAPVFAGFGVALDAGGQLIARGYAATCIGYGAVFLLSRANADPALGKALLIGSLLFNGIETAIQGMAGAAGTALPAIWGTVIAHAVMTVLSGVALAKAR